MNNKAISLISRTDGAVATKLILTRVEVVDLPSRLPTKRREIGRSRQSENTRTWNSPHPEEKGPEYVDIIRNPKHGYGKHMNPW